ncbi:DNA translocase FtsK 4TM domain-containing protein [Geomonas subterranea]|uniref:DNA translocase FtsK 4TM domain-containing protein n=1 Tax=Geomonas subterranea TaxID=2847989 RepID=A0ABX8LDK4_9BACT|nr:DNA translocase FtsK [Geomonas subterranea]QXE90125.1 DNA translocase FtsK 4TM domain-containing protein [Geomonas subterranea]QXM07750.1 DNA translocase FtsK 4TM domain-containing protein [Geomonas subterranea]
MTTEEKIEKKEKVAKEVKGMAFGVAGIFLFIALASFHGEDLSFNSVSTFTQTKNLGGRFGAELADFFLQLFGMASYIFPCTLIYLAYRSFTSDPIRWRRYKLVGFILLLLSLSGLFAFFHEMTEFLGQRVQTGGFIGFQGASLLKRAFGQIGAMLILLPMLAASAMLLSRFSFVLFANWWFTALKESWEKRKQRRALQRELASEKGEKDEKPRQHAAPIIKPAAVPPPVPAPVAKKEKKKDDKKTAPVQEAFDFIKAEGDFKTPPLSLLDPPPEGAKRQDKETLTMNARLMEKKLKDFGVEGEVVEICPGPVITMYEFSPGPGIKVSRIAGLQDDLTMALQAHSIRIVAPIPGKGVVGIELPNRERDMVSLREIFNSEQFHKGKMKLPMALGKDIAGTPLVTDLAKMPHLLVAGATGSGKSVAINTMILSLLYTSTPNDVRIIMVDPKMLELSVYEGIPHLLLPVVTNPKKAALALKWAVEEMGRRYRLMSDKGVRNIDSYNRELERQEKEDAENRARETVVVEEIDESDHLEDPEDMEAREAAIQAFLAKEEQLEHGHLPYIVVIVDELADLMMVAGREIEESIARLAQMARAAGIHLILATQRPSVDVITGLIKANFPARISFQVSSKIDSRTILDGNGAESLLGAGDMLFLPPGTSKMLRSHGAFVSDAEVQRVVEFLKKQGKPVYEKSILEMKAGDEKGGGDDEEDIDERYDDALALVAEAKQASISMIQRRLRIGYNRAARIIEKMEQEGVIGPSDGTSKPREVFINKI